MRLKSVLYGIFDLESVKVKSARGQHDPANRHPKPKIVLEIFDLKLDNREKM